MEGRKQSILKNVSHFQERSTVNLQFQDLTYTIPQGRKGSKVLLKNLNGHFRSGQLSAIMGSSGSGKTTLLNVLAGYKTVGVNGTLMVNGRPLVLKNFLGLSRYIMQQFLLQSFLTVQESMMFAINLQLNKEVCHEDKEAMVFEILEILRLTSAKDTFSNNLSGGQQRRLSVALELINNPPVIFLDEPTTGLDDSSSYQCISLLKALAEGGRTVICSIHTPSARIFEEFDNVYVVSKGLCVYQGYGRNMVTFLSNIGVPCPKHHNPADFIIEMTNEENGDEKVVRMSEAIENGRNESYCNDNGEEKNNKGDSQDINLVSVNSRSKWFQQFKILLYRRCLQTWRNKQYLLLKVVAATIIGVFMGSIYFNNGQDASKILYNCSFCFLSLVQFIYLTLMPISLYFPTEFKLLQREHFNKWYGLTPYYLAMSLSTLPMHLIMIFLSIGISYFMSAQPMELDRIILILLICALVTLVAESHGLLVASIFNVTNGTFMAPVTLIPIVMISLYGIGEGPNIPVLVRLAMLCSYVRYGYEAFIIAIYGNGRSFLECPEEEVICVLRDPKIVLYFVGLQNLSIWINILGLVVWFLIFRIASFYLLRVRLQRNDPIRSLKYLIQNIIHCKF